jgi:hypothetical protein
MATCSYCAESVTGLQSAGHCETCMGLLKSCEVCSEANVPFARYCRRCKGEFLVEFSPPVSTPGRVALAWNEKLDCPASSIRCGLVADRLFVAVAERSWRLYAPFPPRVGRYVSRFTPLPGLIDTPAIVGKSLVAPCRDGLWAMPVGDAWRVDVEQSSPSFKQVYSGSIAAWFPEVDTALVADESGSIRRLTSDGVAGDVVCPAPLPVQQIVVCDGGVVAAGDQGMFVSATSKTQSGKWKIEAASNRAVLLTEGERLHVVTPDDGWAVRPVGDMPVRAAFLVSGQDSRIFVVAVPSGEAGLRSFKLRTGVDPEPLRGSNSNGELFEVNDGRPASGMTFVLAGTDTDTRQPRTRLHAFSVGPDGRLGTAQRSNETGDLLYGPYAIGSVAYAVVKEDQQPTVCCFHLGATTRIASS